MAMPVAMDGKHGFQLDFASNNHHFKTSMSTPTTSTTTNSTTTTSDDRDHDHGCNWNWTCSPVVDWDAFSGGPADEFQYLIDHMMGDEDVDMHQAIEEEEGSNSAVSSSTADMVNIVDDDQETRFEDVKGVRLVHLLMAAAEALVGSSQCTDLARVILVRLKELVSPLEGTNMERLAAHFAEALQALLEEGSAGGRGSLHRNKHTIKNSLHCDQHHQEDMLAAFQLLQDMSPCVKFGHFTANQAILEAVSNDKRVHIVDYDIMEGIQWASLMQAFVSRKDGAPPPHLRITALSRGGSGRRSLGTVQDSGRRLAAFAASIGQPFSFHQCRLDSDETFKPSSLKLVQGEALVFNCMLHLPHFNYRAPDSVASFLSGASSLNPRLLTLVEEELGHIEETGFVGRFMDSLHHYSATYDSLDAGFPLQRRARALVERVFFGPHISGSLARIYHQNGERERVPWREFLSEIGFKTMSMSSANHCQAKLLLGLYNDGYSVEEKAMNNLVLGWKSRPLLSASIWCIDVSQVSII